MARLLWNLAWLGHPKTLLLSSIPLIQKRLNTFKKVMKNKIFQIWKWPKLKHLEYGVNSSLFFGTDVHRKTRLVEAAIKC